MAQLAVSALGAMVGGAIMPGMGGQIGWLLGTAAYSLFMGQKETSTNLDDLKVSASTYGKGIPIVYGTIRVASNMIWSTDLVKKESGKKSGKGKGGMGKGGESYEYYGNWASVLCEGPVDDVIRIWADSKLLWSKFPNEQEIIYKESSKKKKSAVGMFPKSGGKKGGYWGMPCKVYYGTEDQLPDPTIASYEGDAYTPAHRGLCYLVFTMFPLEEWGNRIPSITAEVVVNTDKMQAVPDDQKQLIKITAMPNGQLAPVDGDFADAPLKPAGLHFDPKRGFVYQWVGSTTPGRGILRVFSSEYTEIAQVPETALLGGEVFHLNNVMKQEAAVDGIDSLEDLLGVLPSGDLLFRGAYFGMKNWFVVVSAATATIIQVHNPITANGMALPGTRVICLPAPGPGENERFCLVDAGRRMHFYMQGYNRIEYIESSQLPFYPTNVVYGASVGNGTEVFALETVVAADGYTRSTALWRMDVKSSWERVSDDDGRNARIVQHMRCEDIRRLRTGLLPAATLIAANAGLSLVVATHGNIHAMNAETGATTWNKDVKDLSLPAAILTAGPLAEGYFGCVGGSFPWDVDINAKTVSRSPLYAGDAPSKDSLQFRGLQLWHEGSYQVFGASWGVGDLAYYAVQFGQIRDTIQGQLGQVITDVSRRVGLDDSQINTGLLKNHKVHGIIIDNPLEARSFLDGLARAFLFDAVESDNQIKFVSRGRNPTVTITQDDMAAIDEETNAVARETKVQALDLPEKVVVTHMDPVKDYNTGTQHVKRTYLPLPTMHSRGTVDLTLPMAMSPDQAKQIAERLLYSGWLERVTRDTKLPWTYAYLDPTDVVTFRYDSFEYDDRLIKVTLGANLEIEATSTNQMPETYVSEAKGTSSAGFPYTTRPELPWVRMVVLDTPLLHDTDDPGTGNIRMRVLMLPQAEGYSGAGMRYTFDGTVFSSSEFVAKPTPWGVVAGTIPAPPNGPWAVDETSEITLRPAYLAEGDWSSVTESEWQLGANAIVAGGEVIWYRDAVVNADGSVTISHLLRARRGTEWALADGFHMQNESFVRIMPTLDASGEITEPLTRIGQRVRVQGAFPTATGYEEVSASVVVSNNSVRPYAPAGLARADGEDAVTVRWKRCTRLGGEGLLDWTDTVPLQEPTEAYEVYVLAQPYDAKAAGLGAPASYLRKAEVAAPSFAYGHADIVADGLSPTGALHVVVFQMSSNGGRGFPAWASLRP